MSVKLMATIAISAAVFAVPVESRAAGTDCRQIEVQLTSANTTSTRQNDLLRLRAAAREASCDQALYGERVATCARLNAQIAEVQNSIETLVTQPATDLDALAAINNCRSTDQIVAGSTDNKRLIKEIFGDNPENGSGRVMHVLNASADTSAKPKSSIEIMPEQSAVSSPSFVHPEGEQKAAPQEAAPQSPLRAIDPDRPVRIVGPTFLPDPAESMIEKGPSRSTN
ncbi:hypothetical protein ABFT80_10440 [Mesorhizobium sp. SB112]|uniref:hypothetical protein n=1 Tax=Mesorhizobium sp. SB112 TaxID=3151853 RepID=UPI003264C31A